MTKFELRLIVPAKLVGTIVELVEGEGILVSLTPHHDKRKVVTRHHDPTWTGSKLMEDFLKSNKKFTTMDVVKHFKSHGMAYGSASSRLSWAKSNKLIRSIGKSNYERIS